MNPFAPTRDQRRGRSRNLFGLLLFLLAAATLLASVWPWLEGRDPTGWVASLHPDADPAEAAEAADRGPAEAGSATVRGFGWWCELLRVHLAALALAWLVPALLTGRRLSALLAGGTLVVNGVVVAAVPVRGGWHAAAEALWEARPPGDGGWLVLHVHLAGADRLDALAAEVARAQPDALTAAGARPGVAQSVTPLLDGYRLAGSRPAAGDDGLAVWVRRDVISGAARPDGPTALAANLERGDARLRLVVAAGAPPERPEDAGPDAARVVVGGFGVAPWSLDPPPAHRLLPPGHLRPWPPPLDHAWADLPAGWAATTAAAPPIDDAPSALHRPLWIRLSTSDSAP